MLPWSPVTHISYQSGKFKSQLPQLDSSCLHLGEKVRAHILGPNHPHGEPTWSSQLLAFGLVQSPLLWGIWGVNRQMNILFLKKIKNIKLAMGGIFED